MLNRVWRFKGYGEAGTVRDTKRKVRTIVTVLCACIVTAAWGSLTSNAQISLNAPTPSKAILQSGTPSVSLKGMSLLDPERFSMHQEYMMNFSSTGGNGGVMGMYVNSMEYRFNAPLILRLKVAYQSQTGMLFGQKDSYSGLPQTNQGRLFVPSFDLVYKPWKNTTIGISFRDLTPMYASNSYQRYSPYSRYGMGYGMGYDMGFDSGMYNMLYGWDRFDRVSQGR
jgi:hypothetical protein